MSEPLHQLSLYTKELEDKILKYSQKCSSSKNMAIKILFWNLKFLFKNTNKKPSFNDKKMHVAVEFTGGVGDFVSSAKYVEGLSKYLGEKAIIDLICEDRFLDSVKDLIHNKKYIKNVLTTKKQNYDLEIRVVRFPLVMHYFPQRLTDKALDYVSKVNIFQKQNPMVFQNDFIGTCLSLNEGRTRENQADIDNILDLKNLDFSLSIKSNVFEILAKFALNEKSFITIQTGAGACFSKYQTDTRQWDVSKYEELVTLLKKEYPNYKIVQVGEKRQNAIQNVDMDLRGKTSFSELLVLLKTAKLHISQEGGMVILRHFLEGGKSVVLFGPTDEKFYGFPENINISARPCPYPCEWITKNWMKECMRSGKRPECIYNLLSSSIVEEISKNNMLGREI